MTELTLHLPPDLALALSTLAKKQGHTIQDVVLAELRRALSVLGGSSRRSVLRGLSGRGLLERNESSHIHLTSPVIALVEGLLTDETTVVEALRNGDFGLGTLNKLDGEVVVLDGVAYQQGPTGACRTVDPSEKTPFMSLTFFKPDKAESILFEGRLQYDQLLEQLEDRFPSENIFYAIKVVGRFDSLRLRSVRKQEVDRPLVAVAADQAVFEVGAASGTLVGFWSPTFVGSALTVPGFHFHFLDDDRTQGGHVLDLVLLEGTGQIQALYHATADMPKTRQFMRADLTRDPAADLHKAET